MSAPDPRAEKVRHAKSVANPDWPYESYCVGCGEEWPCSHETDETCAPTEFDNAD